MNLNFVCENYYYKSPHTLYCINKSYKTKQYIVTREGNPKKGTISVNDINQIDLQTKLGDRIEEIKKIEEIRKKHIPTAQGNITCTQ